MDTKDLYCNPINLELYFSYPALVKTNRGMTHKTDSETFDLSADQGTDFIK